LNKSGEEKILKEQGGSGYSGGGGDSYGGGRGMLAKQKDFMSYL
jgi:hypothetical protein